MQDSGDLEISRRNLMIGGAASAAATAVPSVVIPQPVPDARTSRPPVMSKVSFDVNGQVHALYITSAFVNEHREEAASAVRRAFDESASVEHVSGEAAERLDAAGGIAARLRFVISPEHAEPAEAR